MNSNKSSVSSLLWFIKDYELNIAYLQVKFYDIILATSKDDGISANKITITSMLLMILVGR